MAEYWAKDLKEQFEGLKDIGDLVLAPLFDVAVDLWLDQLPNDNIVSDMQKERNHDNFQKYTCVVDGKIVTVSFQSVNIDVDDDDEEWHVTKTTYFSGNKEASVKLAGRCREYVGSRNLEELMTTTREELRKGKIYHLSRDMYQFYFGKYG